MAYDKSDPRSSLATNGQPSGANVAPQYFEFDHMDPVETTAAGSRTWLVRSQSGIVAFTEAKAGDSVSREDQPDEFTVLLPEPGARARIIAATEAEPIQAVGRALVIVPPGDSAVTVDRDAVVVRLFSTRSADLCARSTNNSFYETPDPNVAPFRAWPAPTNGYRVRVYDLDGVAPDPDRFGRIYRSTTVMVNYLYDAPGPRDPRRLSPHHHDDFEQISLQLAGDYVHHIRTPWTIDSWQWREDEHRACSSPAVTVIPPPSIHTSEAVGETSHHLVDVFCPPRHDFSARPGWVLNADEYPAPAD